jgi:hypothetical protein
MPSVRLTVLVLTLACPLVASAQGVFKCVDDRGRVTYTNDRNLARGCAPLTGDQPVSSVPSATPESSPAPAQTRSPAKPAASNGDFPRVTPETQRSRDDNRRQVLEKELEAEQDALSLAREKLEAEEGRDAPEDRNVMRGGRATINLAKREERLEPFRNAVELHERNVEALQRELSRLR